MTGEQPVGQGWTDDRILEAVCEWGWAPEGSEVIETGEYRVVVLPESWGGAVSVPWLRSARPAEVVVEEVHALARERGAAEVTWSVYPLTRPDDVETLLMSRGGQIRDEGGLMSLRVPADGQLDVGDTSAVTVRLVDDLASLTDYRRIVSTVFEQPMPDAGSIEAEAVQLGPHNGEVGKFVASLGGRPISTGTVQVRSDGSASLFGAATLEQDRGNGGYRAVLAARTRWAHEHGVAVLLVSGRVGTSFPIMRRAGFSLHGYTRGIAVPVG